MSRKIRTARGAMIDMAAMATKHEDTRAVGNVPMNAKGDRLNRDGTIKISAEDIAIAHHNATVPPEQQPLSNTKPIVSEKPTTKKSKTEDPIMPDLEEQFTQEPEAISKITRTREDGTKYVEIEYDDGSIETIEVKLDEE